MAAAKPWFQVDADLILFHENHDQMASMGFYKCPFGCQGGDGNPKLHQFGGGGSNLLDTHVEKRHGKENCAHFPENDFIGWEILVKPTTRRLVQTRRIHRELPERERLALLEGGSRYPMPFPPAPAQLQGPLYPVHAESIEIMFHLENESDPDEAAQQVLPPTGWINFTCPFGCLNLDNEQPRQHCVKVKDMLSNRTMTRTPSEKKLPCANFPWHAHSGYEITVSDDTVRKITDPESRARVIPIGEWRSRVAEGHVTPNLDAYFYIDPTATIVI
jgi:hypothetical protein